MSTNSFDAKAELTVGERSYEIFRLDALQAKYDVARLPFSLKILLENLLRNEDGEAIRAPDVEALATWNASEEPSKEIAFTPARVLMQDFTGVPAVVDLAAMRDAIAEMGGDPAKINPLVPAELAVLGTLVAARLTANLVVHEWHLHRNPAGEHYRPLAAEFMRERLRIAAELSLGASYP